MDEPCGKAILVCETSVSSAARRSWVSPERRCPSWPRWLRRIYSDARRVCCQPRFGFPCCVAKEDSHTCSPSIRNSPPKSISFSFGKGFVVKYSVLGAFKSSDTTRRARDPERPLITSDGFEFYARVVREIYGSACIYGQVIKTWRKSGVARVERVAVIGSPRQLADAFEMSEDSRKLNTSFIERQNLTVRHGSAYLCRRSLCHAKSGERLVHHLELQRCYQNFVRRHSALQFGPVTRTPAMQAGLATRALTFREIFLLAMVAVFLEIERLWTSEQLKVENRLRLAA